MIFVLCFCYLFLEVIFCTWRVYSILLSVVCKHKIAIFMSLVSTFSLHHYIWDCRPVLSLTAFWVLADFCCKVALSCSIDTGVIPKPWDCICNSMCMPLIRQSRAQVLQAVTFRLEVKHRTSHLRFLFVVCKRVCWSLSIPFELLSFDYG
jgi:hypothetical protein